MALNNTCSNSWAAIFNAASVFSPAVLNDNSMVLSLGFCKTADLEPIKYIFAKSSSKPRLFVYFLNVSKSSVITILLAFFVPTASVSSFLNFSKSIFSPGLQSLPNSIPIFLQVLTISFWGIIPVALYNNREIIAILYFFLSPIVYIKTFH